MKVGDYVRTKYGITQIKENVCLLDEVIKSSPNIIDLIEENDVIHFEFYGIDNINNVMKENDILNVGYDEDGDIITLKDIEIKSIVTKEQFESMEYKI